MPDNVKNIIFFDGVCNLCNGLVNFIIKHDKKGIFYFASLQSEWGKKALVSNGLNPNELNTVILLYKGSYYVKSKAVIIILQKLGFPYSLLVVFRVLPTFIADYFYHLIAKNRYKWFGKKEHCRLPTEAEKLKFIS